LTPKPIIKQVNIKFNSNLESEISDRAEKVEVSHAKNKYKKANIMKRAPN
jgi:hypothetical protein